MEGSPSPTSKPTSIVCLGLDDQVNTKPIMVDHFSRFGTVVGVNCSKANKHAVIHFSNPADAKNAKDNGTIVHTDNRDYPAMEIFFSAKRMTSPEGVRKLSSTKKTIQRTIPNLGSPAQSQGGERGIRSRLGSIPKRTSTSTTATKSSITRPLPSPKLKSSRPGGEGKSPFKLKRMAFTYPPQREIEPPVQPQIFDDDFEEGELDEVKSENFSQSTTDSESTPSSGFPSPVSSLFGEMSTESLLTSGSPSSATSTASALAIFGEGGDIGKTAPFKFSIPKNSDTSKLVFGGRTPEREAQAQSVPGINTLKHTGVTPKFESLEVRQSDEVAEKQKQPFAFKLPGPTTVASSAQSSITSPGQSASSSSSKELQPATFEKPSKIKFLMDSSETEEVLQTEEMPTTKQQPFAFKFPAPVTTSEARTARTSAAPSQSFVHPPRIPPQSSTKESSIKFEETPKVGEIISSPAQRKLTTKVDPGLETELAELQEHISKRTTTSEERYRLLEARDRIIRIKNPKVKMRVEQAVRLIGTCEDMCPERERYMREAQRLLSLYEYLPGRDFEVNHYTAVKIYSRSSADQEEPLAHELRSSAGLQLTINYLLHNIINRCENEGENLFEWYNFVWDRTRSIRKDISQQQLCDLQTVALMEKCARFHIFCASRLCELDRYYFDPKLNDENLMKCIQSLEQMYTDLKLKGTDCPNEPEFRSYQILMKLNEGDILWEIQQNEERVFHSPEVQLALKIQLAIFNKNFVAFFRLVRKASFLTACILHRYFYQVRLKALKTIVKAHSRNYSAAKYEAVMSLEMVQKLLGYGPTMEEDFLWFCEEHGVTCDLPGSRLIVGRRQLRAPEAPIIKREKDLIESKLIVPVSQVINGGGLGPNPSLSYTPLSSFDADGYFVDSGNLLEPKPISEKRISFQPTAVNQGLAKLPEKQPFRLFGPDTSSQVRVGAIRLTEESSLDGRIRFLPPSFTPQLPIVPVRPILEPPKFPKEIIDRVIQGKLSEIVEPQIIKDVSEIAKEELVRKLRQAQIEQELKLAQDFIANQTLNRTMEQVVSILVKEVAEAELSKVIATQLISASIAEEVTEVAMFQSIRDIADTALDSKTKEWERMTRTVNEKLGRVVLTHWLQMWRRNILDKRILERRRSDKMRRDLENCPPIQILPMSSETIMSNFGSLATDSSKSLSLSKLQDSSNSLDLIERTFDVTKSFTSWLKDKSPSIVSYFAQQLRHQLSKIGRRDSIFQTNLLPPVIFNIVLISEFEQLDTLPNWFWANVEKTCRATGDEDVVLSPILARTNNYFISFRKFNAQAAMDVKNIDAAAGASGIIIFLRSPKEKNILANLIHYLSKPSSILVVNSSSLSDEEILRIMRADEIEKNGLTSFITILSVHGKHLFQDVPLMIRGIDKLASTLPLSADLNPAMIFPSLHVLLHVLVRDVFPECVAHLSCPFSLFEAHNEFMDKIKGFLKIGCSQEVLDRSNGIVVQAISNEWPELETVLPPREVRFEEVVKALGIMYLPPLSRDLEKGHDFPLGKSFNRRSKEFEEATRYLHQYVIKLRRGNTSALNAKIQVEDLLMGQWTQAPWKIFIQICQNYLLDCLEEQIGSSGLKVGVSPIYLHSLRNPISDTCVECLSRSKRKRGAEPHSIPEMTICKSSRHAASISSLLEGIQDLIRDVKTEKEMYSLPPSLSGQ